MINKNPYFFIVRTRRLILVFYLILIQIIGTYSYAIDLNFKYYAVEDGLSSNIIYSIIQDSSGYIWIGTEDGLNRFDGYEFVSFRNIPRDTTSIRNNHVYSLFEDSERKIWIGTENGISIYDLETEKFHSFSVKTANGASIKDKVQNILFDENGLIWINANKQGAFVYNKEQNTLEQFPLVPYSLNTNTGTAYITCLYKDKSDNMWASINHSEYQIYFFDKHSRIFVPAFPSEEKLELKKMASYSILEDNFGTLWFGSWDNGLYAVDKKEGVKSNYLNTPNKDKILHIHSITELEPGKLLIGSNDGLTSFLVSSVIPNKMDMQIKEPQLSSRFVYPIFKDKEGGLWIGTYYGGINYSSPNRNYFASYTHDPYKNSVSGTVISTFCEDQSGNIWIGSDNGGVSHFNTKTEHFTVYMPEKDKNSLSFHNVHALCADNDYLWIGTYTGGLNRMDLKKKTFKHYESLSSDSSTVDSNSIYALFLDSEDNLWVGSMQGINLYDKETDCFVRMRNLGSMIVDIAQTGDTIWFATIGFGVISYNLVTEVWKDYTFNFDDPSSIISNDISCFCIDEHNRFWVGTNSGLCLYNQQEDSFNYIETGFESNFISCIFSENGSLWIATTKGFVNYDPQNRQFRTFNKADGLLSDQFMINSGIKASNGRIYVGTANGFNAFYPKQIIVNRYIPPVEITDFQIFNNLVNLKEKMVYDKNGNPYLKFPYKENSFTFEYTALSYFAPEKNEYAYILTGFDKQWNNVGKNRRAIYTNIPPGEYTFKIKASNNDGFWNDAGKELKIIITPPFWWNKWAIFFYSFIVIGAMAFIIYYLNKKSIIDNNEKLEKLKREQEKEVYNSKINFFTTIAHEIRTPVSLIIGPLEETIKSVENFPAKVVNNLNMIDRNAQRLLSLVNQILDFQKIEKNTIQINLTLQNLHELLEGIYIRFKPSLKQKNIDFIFTSESKNFETGVDVELLTKVISNLLTNANKFTSDFVELSLQIQPEKDSFIISVVDNGIGISEEEQKNIFKPFYQVPGEYRPGTGLGLHTVKSIVDAWKGEISIDSEPGKGTTVSISLPICNADCSTKMEKQSSDYLITNPVLKKDLDNLNRKAIQTEENILIVEDNEDMQEFIFNNLTKNYHVFLAKDGLEGLEILEKKKISLIVSDVMMPNMDGVQFCNTVKNNFLWDHIPFIMLTSKTNLDFKIEALEMGADSYIEKPFSMPFLLAQIKNLLDSRKSLYKKYTENPFISAEGSSRNKADEEFLIKAKEIIDKNISNVDFTIEQLAEEMYISSSGLFAKIKNIANITPNKLLLYVRLKKAAELLLENKYRISEVCYMVGFNNPSYFAKCFQKQYGVLPKDFKGNPE